MKRDITTIHIDGEQLKFERDKLISICEAKGFSALRSEQSPHTFWQLSEYLKRERK